MTGYRRPDARIHLNGFFPFGPVYVWDEVEDPRDYYRFEGFAQLARTAERGLFTAIFLGDSQRLREHLGRITDTAVTGRPDQLVLFAHLAAVTERIGLVATLNTTFSEPTELGRRLATVDALSNGRIGWNVVTTDNAWTAENFRRGNWLSHDDRYTYALEHLTTVRRFADPMIFQAGESGEGRDFAARHAEAIFSRYLEFDAALAFADDLARRLERFGRGREDVRIIPGARITLGATEAEAREKAAWFDRRTWSDRRVRAVIEAVWGCDLSGHDVDGPLPSFDPVEEEQTKTHGVVNSRDRPLETAAAWRRLADKKSWTIRELVAHLSRSVEFVGTPGAVADRLAHYVRSGAIDGLNVAPTSFPDGFDDIVDLLVPELQARGVYPTAYPAATIRANYR